MFICAFSTFSCYHLAVFLYIWESERFPDNTDNSFLNDEIKSAKNDWHHWAVQIEVNQAKNPAKKFLLKTKRKLGI